MKVFSYKDSHTLFLQCKIRTHALFGITFPAYAQVHSWLTSCNPFWSLPGFVNGYRSEYYITDADQNNHASLSLISQTLPVPAKNNSSQLFGFEPSYFSYLINFRKMILVHPLRSERFLILTEREAAQKLGVASP